MLEFTRTLAAGIPPSNDLLLRVIMHAERLLSGRDFNPFDRTTARIAADIQHLLESARRMIAERNRGEELQEILYHGTKGATQVAPKLAGHARAVSGAAPSPSAAYTQARELVFLFIRSGEFRDIAVELAKVLQQLVQVRGNIIGTGDSGRPEDVVVETVTTTTRTEYDSYGRPYQTQSTSRAAEVMPASAAAGLSNVTYQGMQPPQSQLPVVPSSQFGGASGGNEAAIRAELRARFRTLLGRIASNPAMRKGFTSLLDMLDQVQTVGADSGTAAAKTVYKNEELRLALRNARLLLEQFTGGRSMSTAISAFKSLLRMVRNDRDLHAFFSDARAYLVEVMENPRVADDDQRLVQLLTRLRRFMEDQRFADYTNSLFTESRLLMSAIRADPVATQFAGDLRRLMQDLFLDGKGQPTIKLDALRGLKNVLVALLMDELKSLPLPPISGGNADMQYSVSNIALTFFDLLPEDIEIKNKTKTKMHPTNISMPASNWSDSKGKFKVIIHKMPTRIDNIDYWFKKTSGYKIEDRGRMWIELLRKGATLKMTVNAYYGEKYPHFFKVKNIRCRIDKLKIHFVQTEHRALLGFAMPFMKGAIRRQAERAIEENLAKSIASLEQAFHEWVMRVPLPAAVTDRIDRNEAVRYVDKLLPVMEDSYGYSDNYHPGGVNRVQHAYGAPYVGGAGAAAGAPAGWSGAQYAQAAHGVVYGREAVRH